MIMRTRKYEKSRKGTTFFSIDQIFREKNAKKYVFASIVCQNVTILVTKQFICYVLKRLS